jgi:hypothetical protein
MLATGQNQNRGGAEGRRPSSRQSRVTCEKTSNHGQKTNSPMSFCKPGFGGRLFADWPKDSRPLIIFVFHLT